MNPTCARLLINLLLLVSLSSAVFAQTPIGEGDFKFEIKHRVNVHGDEFNALAKSSDGQRLFTGTEKGDILVWNVAANRVERTLHQPSAVHFVAVLANSRELIAASSNHVEPRNALVRKWNVETGTFVDLNGIDNASSLIAFATDNDAGLVAATAEKGMVVVWDSRTNNQLAQWKFNAAPTAVALLGRNVYVGSEGAIVKLNVDDQKQQPTDVLRVANRDWLVLEPSPDHRLLSATYRDGYRDPKTVVIDPVAKAVLGNFEHSASLWLSAAKLMLFSWLDPTEVVQISTRGPAKSIRKFERFESDTPGRAFVLSGQVSNADGSKVWTSYGKGPGLLEFDLRSNKIKTLIGGPSGAYALSITTQDGQTGELLTGGADGYVRLWNLADISLIKEYKIAKPGYFVSEAHLVPGSRQALVDTRRIPTEREPPGPGEIINLDLETGQQKKLFDLLMWRARIAVVENQVVYPEGDRIKFKNIDGSESGRELKVDGLIGPTAVSANKRWLAVIDQTEKLTVFDLKSEQKTTIPLELNDSGPLVVTDDGQHVYRLAHGGTLFYWNVSTGKVTSSVLTRIREMYTQVDFMTLANNDRWLVTAGNHHDVGIFDRVTGRLVFYGQTGAAAFWVEKVWTNGNRMIVTTDTGVLYDGILK